jgi:hypothetical protein
MLHRRLAAVTPATLAALSLLALPAAAAGAQDEALVRLAHFAPGLVKGDVYVAYVNGRLRLKGVPFKTVSDYLKSSPAASRSRSARAATRRTRRRWSPRPSP